MVFLRCSFRVGGFIFLISRTSSSSTSAATEKGTLDERLQCFVQLYISPLSSSLSSTGCASRHGIEQLQEVASCTGSHGPVAFEPTPSHGVNEEVKHLLEKLIGRLYDLVNWERNGDLDVNFNAKTLDSTYISR